MTVPDPDRTGRPSTGMDPMPRSSPVPPLGEDIPDPTRPGQRPGQRPDPRDPRRPEPTTPDGRLHLVAAGREDRYRHVVDVDAGELGDPAGLRGRCGASVEQVVPGMRPEQADCPGCRLASVLPS